MPALSVASAGAACGPALRLALLEGGVDLLTIETIPDTAEMHEAIAAARECSDLPIIAMLTFAEDGRTVSGNEAAVVIDMLLEHDVDVIGANCSVGPQRLLRVIDAYRRELDRRGVDLPLACIPNAGWPTQQGGRVIYPSSPDYFAKFALQAAEAGVSVIGGCCGTTPAHIEAMSRAMRERTTGEIQERPSVISELVISESIQSAPATGQYQPDGFRSELGRKFLVAVEIDPPKGLNPEKALVGAELLKRAGVDAINVADSPMARVRMSALTLCMMIQHQVDVETIVHFTTRDRSLMGIQSELLGAHAAGVRTVFLQTGRLDTRSPDVLEDRWLLAELLLDRLRRRRHRRRVGLGPRPGAALGVAGEGAVVGRAELGPVLHRRVALRDREDPGPRVAVGRLQLEEELVGLDAARYRTIGGVALTLVAGRSPSARGCGTGPTP